MSANSKTLGKRPGGLSDRASDVVLVVLSIAILLVVAYPLYYILVASVSDPYDVYAGKTFWLPSQFTLKGYAAVFSDDSILMGYWNSIKYTVVGTAFSVIMIYITAYPLSNPDLPGRKFFNIFFVITMYFGGGLIPTYLIVRDTGLINTIWAMFLPGGVAVSNMIIARNFFETSIPKELKEAAEIDGASKLRIFWDIIIPLSKPIMAVMVVFSMVAYWNDWFTALIYMTGEGRAPLPLVLRNILIASETSASQASCGGSGNTVEPGTVNTNTEQTSFNIISGISALSGGYDSNEVLNTMAQNAGITITWDTMSDSLSEQVNIRIAGNDLPDAFNGVGFSNYDLTNYGEDGTFIDLTPYITEEYMPNLTKILEEHPDIRAAITMDDGCIYGLPAGEQMGTAGIGKEQDYNIYTIPQYSMINKAWLDELGPEVPTTLDELHDALKAFKDNDMSATYYGNDAGSTIPMSFGIDQWCWGQNIFYAGFGFTNWTNDICADLVLQPDGTVNFVSDDDNYRAALEYFHNWFAEGLIDQEAFSQTDTQYMAKCSQGEVGVATWWYIEELMGDYADDYVFLPVLEGPDGSCNVTVRDGGGINSGNLSITSACESPINLLKFYDQWYDPENVMQLQYGPIGTYFTEQDENGLWQSISDEEAQQKFGKSAGEVKSEYEVYGPKLILSDYYATTFEMEPRAVERLTDLYDYWMPFVKDTTTYPIDCVYTEDELDTIDKWRVDFENFVAEQEATWLRDGGITDDTWNAYKENLNSYGMQELLEVYQAAYDRYEETAGAADTTAPATAESAA